MTKKLYRSQRDHVVAGLAGGIGEYFGIDANVIRLGLLLTMVFGGGGIIAYIVGWIIIPPESGDSAEASMFHKSEVWRRRLMHGAKQMEAHLHTHTTPVTEPAPMPDANQPEQPEQPEQLEQPEQTIPHESAPTHRQQIGGAILIAIGLFMIVLRFFPWINIVAWLWPFIIVGLGVILIVRGLHE